MFHDMHKFCIFKRGDAVLNSNVLNQVAILTLMMIVGVILRKVKIINEDLSKGLSNILVNVTMPFLIINSFTFSFSSSMFKKGIMVFFYSILIHIVLIALSKVAYFKFSDEKKNIMKFSSIFSNCGFVGYPLIAGLYGKVGIFYTSIYTIPFNMFIWSYGVLLFKKKSEGNVFKKVFLTPPMISMFIGLIIFFFSIKLPNPVIKTTESIGNMTTPLSMFVIGAMLAEVKLKDIFSGISVYYVNIIKLVVAPVIVLLALKILNVDKTVLSISVILTAMPSATLVGIFAQNYGGDKAFASKCAFLSTILSVITIPFIIMLL